MRKNEIEEIFSPEVPEVRQGNPESFLFACGKNDSGELTFRDYRLIDKPSGVHFSLSQQIHQVSSGANHTAFITQGGQLYTFGSSLHGKLGLKNLKAVNTRRPTLLPESQGNPVQQVTCGDYHTLALCLSGDVLGFGGTLHKKLGAKTSLPSRITGFGKVKVVKIGCGDFHSAALSSRLIRQRHSVHMGWRRAVIQPRTVRTQHTR